MKQKLQDFSHQHSDYQRPNLNRDIVAESAIGNPAGDAAEKSATDTSLSAMGEFAMPSLRAKRNAFTWAITALTIGFLLIAFNSPWSKEFLAPGPLSSPHAQLLAGQGVERCAACHGAASEGFSGWLTGHHGANAQSELCMKCHENTIDAAFALQPHGISQQDLSRNANNTPEKSFSGKLVSMVGLSHSSEVACSVCHKEHHGNVSLSQLTDRQCQSCHAQTFHSFETDHPEFNQWPQIKRQNIAFDHQTHLNLHFKNAKTEFNCNLCHVDDGSQKVKRMASFEQACGNCHAQQIADSGQSGWTLFELPRLDMAAIEDLNLNVGNWPASATSDFDGDLPPMMRMLLGGDPQMQNVVSRLEPDFSFGDVDIDDVESVELAVELVWGIKRLLHDLAQDGQSAIDRRLASVMGDQFSSEISQGVLKGLNPEIFAATAKRWLPDIEKELAKQEMEEISFSKRSTPMHLTAFVKPVAPLQELLAPNPLSGEAFQSAVKPDDRDVLLSVPDESDSGATTDSFDIQIPSANFGSSELLAPNPLKGSSAEPSSPGVGATVESSETLESDSRPEPLVRNNVRPSPPQAMPPKELHLLPEVAGVAIRSGWYRNDRFLRIGYRPHGHADLVVKSWSDCVSRVVDADTNPASSALMAKVNSPTSAGNCRSCHSVSRSDGGLFELAWSADQRNDQRSSFTKFSHRPHLTQWSISECATCHRMNEAVSLVGTFDGFDARVGMSNFHPIVKSDCSSCHQKGRTDSGCMQCHNYHVGRP